MLSTIEKAKSKPKKEDQTLSMAWKAEHTQLKTGLSQNGSLLKMWSGWMQ